VKAIVQERFGPPEVLRLVDTDPPGAGAGEVLVRVHAAALNPYDWHIMRGDPLIARLMGEVGLTKPKARVAGIDAAGVVEAAGANVRGLANGDEVLGYLRGAFAEYACAAADLVVPKPVAAVCCCRCAWLTLNRQLNCASSLTRAATFSRHDHQHPRKDARRQKY